MRPASLPSWIDGLQSESLQPTGDQATGRLAASFPTDTAVRKMEPQDSTSGTRPRPTMPVGPRSSRPTPCPSAMNASCPVPTDRNGQRSAGTARTPRIHVPANIGEHDAPGGSDEAFHEAVRKTLRQHLGVGGAETPEIIRDSATVGPTGRLWARIRVAFPRVPIAIRRTGPSNERLRLRGLALSGRSARNAVPPSGRNERQPLRCSRLVPQNP